MPGHEIEFPLALVILPLSTVPDGTSASLVASKQGDRVVFTIANGGRPHQVYRSTAPDGLARDRSLSVQDGVFVDPFRHDEHLVFYRID